MENSKDDKQAPKKGQANKKLQLDGLKEAFEGEPLGMEGELGKKYVVDDSGDDKENKPVKYRNKKDEPEYKGPPDNG